MTSGNSHSAPFSIYDHRKPAYRQAYFFSIALRCLIRTNR
jgi:hypothetical protein